MKNKFKLILLFIILITFSGCKKKEKIIIESMYNIQSCVELNYDELKNKLEYIDNDNNKISGDNFILYIYTSSCTSCINFETNVLNEYIKQSRIVIYKIDYELINDLISTPSIYSSNPRLCIFNNGSLYTQTNQSSNEKVFNSVDNLRTYFNKYIQISSVKIINNLEDLNSIINNSCVVLFGWNKCGDCQYLNTHYLKQLEKESYSNLYYFEVNDYRKYKNSEQESIWNNFVTTYNLDKNNANAYVPVFNHYNNGMCDESYIYFNDELEDNNSKLKVISTPNPINIEYYGLEFNSMDDYRKGTEKYHNKYLNNFLNKYLTKN